jgi:hypothetical protein
MANEQDPSHWSSQNLTLLSFPTFLLYSILSAWTAHIAPFQKGEELLSLEQKMLGEQVLYLASIICFHNLPSLSWYVWTHEANKHRFKFLRSGIPKPPWSFLSHRDWILDRWYLCLSLVSSQKNCHFRIKSFNSPFRKFNYGHQVYRDTS